MSEAESVEPDRNALPDYECRSCVKAAQIISVEFRDGKMARLWLRKVGALSLYLDVSHAWMARTEAKAGDYLVRNAHGRETVMEALAFEAVYYLLPKTEMAVGEAEAKKAMREYTCHKRVMAASIVEVEVMSEKVSRLWLAVDGDPQPTNHTVTQAWMDQHTPEKGGYLVRYADGYESYSPAAAFEEGYSLTEPAKINTEVAHHPATAALLSFFEYDHLPPRLQEVSKPYCTLAYQLATQLPSNAEVTVALRKLLESKDCAVRAALLPRAP